MASLVVSNFLLLGIGYYMVKLTARVLLIPSNYLGPAVIALCIVGAYAATYDIYGVWVMFGTGLLGYVMLRVGIPIGPLALGLVLGPIAEKGLAQSLQMAESESSLLSFILSRPISVALILLCAVALFAALYVEKKTRQAEGRKEEIASE
jgi:putative tricarboxylic transport membrane protein